MKKLLLVATVCACFLSLLGCQQQKQTFKPIETDTGVEVAVEGGGQFPEFLVGKWRGPKKSGWEFIFEPNGSIASAVISLGRVKLKPGRKTTVPMKYNKEGIFEPGKWLVQYVPASRELTIKIDLKYFNAQMGNSTIEGKSLDVFSGTVSEDGKSWKAKWTGFPDYTIHTPKRPNFKMLADPNYGRVRDLTFRKVTQTKTN